MKANVENLIRISNLSQEEYWREQAAAQKITLGCYLFNRSKRRWRDARTKPSRFWRLRRR